MEEVEKFEKFLTLLEQLGGSPSTALNEEAPLSSDLRNEDAELESWASLLVGASDKLIRNARVRTCQRGLAAVNSHIKNSDGK
jgi:hypothetical protein